MTVNDTSTLTTLVPPSSYLLAYAVPLLLISILLNFSGAFLTLDRSRSFAPQYDAIPGAFDRPKRKLYWLLEGGVGGLAIGYAFGVHLSTFLALLIPAISTSSPLGSKSFIAVWLLSCILTAGLAGRWKYCAFAFAGISGGALFAIAVSVIIHPPLLARIVLTAIFAPVLTILTLLPLVQTQHAALRFATASTGAFGIVVSIALLAGIPAWANVWERLWVATDATGTWGTTKEKGLSAGYCLFLAAGITCDWLLRAKLGECPDEKWDGFLARYAANLPNSSGRAGTFRPLTSFWERLFGAPVHRDILFPPSSKEMDDDLKTLASPSISPGALKLQKESPGFSRSESFEFQPSPGFLKKGRSQGATRFHARMGGKRNKEAVRFRPLGADDLSSDEDDDEDDFKSPLSEKTARPWLRQKVSMSSTTPTLVEDNGKSKKGGVDIDYEKDMAKLKQQLRKNSAGLGEGEVPEYSDHEDDITSSPLVSPRDVNSKKEWSPGFMDRHRGASHSSSTAMNSKSAASASSSSSPPPPLQLAPVPATPSLIKAIDRIAVAQKDAHVRRGVDGMPAGDAGEEHHGETNKGVRWDEFWREVQQKAGTGR